MPLSRSIFLNLLSLMAYVLCSSHSTTTSLIEQRKDKERNLNEKEITIVINSSFMIIEEMEVANVTKLNSVTINPMSKRGSIRNHNSSTCRTLSISEKYRVLENVGARNQLYMAETPEEASRGFVVSTSSLKQNLKATFADTVDGSDSTNCNEECEVIKKTLEEILEQRSNAKEPARAISKDFVVFKDASAMEVDEIVNTKGGCTFETFVPLGNCSEPGDEVAWVHEQLCSTCRGIYVLGENCFPTFFNSVLCNEQETGCIFDSFSDRAHGVCRSETLSLRVLHNRGDEKCEDWIIEQIELPVACQCLLSKGSWLRTHPPREL